MIINDNNNSTLPSSIGLASFFWINVRDKYKKRNNRNNGRDGHRLPTPSEDDKIKGQTFNQPPSMTPENSEVDHKGIVPGKPTGRSYHYRPAANTRSQENTERLEAAPSTPRRATWSATDTSPKIPPSALKTPNACRASLPDIAPIRHVRFSTSEIEGNDEQASAPSSSAKTLIKNLLWTDGRGVCGSYTGQVNECMHPDGRGALVYHNGEARTCIWKDGAPVSPWAPKTRKEGRNESKSETKKAKASAGNDTFLPHVDIGDIGKPHDMVREKPSQTEVDALRKHDFVFVKRSIGESWTYAIIASRNDADGIRFVVDADGSTKKLSRKHWQTHVRLVSTVHSTEEQE